MEDHIGIAYLVEFPIRKHGSADIIGNLNLIMESRFAFLFFISCGIYL